MVAHTTLLEIMCHSSIMADILMNMSFIKLTLEDGPSDKELETEGSLVQASLEALCCV